VARRQQSMRNAPFKTNTIAQDFLFNATRSTTAPLLLRVVALNLRQNNLGDDGAKVVAFLAQTLPLLSTLNCSKNRLKRDGVLALVSIDKLKSFEKMDTKVRPIVDLDLSRNNLTTVAITSDPIIEAIRNESFSVQRLHLMDNQLSYAHKRFQAFTDAIKTNKSIVYLDLQDNEVGGWTS
jgi:hypothetical protein